MEIDGIFKVSGGRGIFGGIRGLLKRPHSHCCLHCLCSFQQQKHSGVAKPVVQAPSPAPPAIAPAKSADSKAEMPQSRETQQDSDEAPSPADQEKCVVCGEPPQRRVKSKHFKMMMACSVCDLSFHPACRSYESSHKGVAFCSRRCNGLGAQLVQSPTPSRKTYVVSRLCVSVWPVRTRPW
jgi:hypothetical protein